MTQPPKILFVDDDDSFLELARRASTRYTSSPVEVITASNANDALKVLQEIKVDLAAIDLRMPVVDGLQLMILLRRKFPHLVKVALTGDVSETARANAFNSGAELYLTKPNNQKDWENAFAAFHELINFEPEAGFRGILSEISLQDILQLSCLTRRSMVLRVRSRKADGTIYIKNGEILHAVCGEFLGEEAFIGLLSLTAGDFEVESYVEPPDETIDQPWEFLLMEACRKIDEATQKQGKTRTGNTDLLALLSATARAGSDTDTGALRLKHAVGQKKVDETQPLIEELLVSARHPEPQAVYAWQTANSKERIEFLQQLSQDARQLAQTLPLGEFERLEVDGPQQRAVAIVREDRFVFVRTSRLPVNVNP